MQSEQELRGNQVAALWQENLSGAFSALAQAEKNVETAKAALAESGLLGLGFRPKP